MSRLVIIKGFFFIFFCIIGIRLGFWQIVKASDLKALSTSQRSKIQNLKASRGQIFFSDGFPMVSNIDLYDVIANPQLFKPDFLQGQALLKALVSTESASLIQEAQLATNQYFPIAKRVTSEKKELISSLKLPGLTFEANSSRFYPEGSPSAHIAGFVGQDSLGLAKGYFGLEGYYNRELVGKDGRLLEELDPFGEPILIAKQNYIPKQDGRNLLTSINRTFQFIAFQKLVSGVSKYQADSGTVTIMDPFSGNILAMASWPGYEPTQYHKYDSNLYKNPVISFSFEPGSTFKTIVMASALDAGAITPKTICSECSKALQISDYPIKTWNNEYHPQSTMSEIIQNSDNVGMVFVAKRLGNHKLVDYITKFGFNSPTGVDLEEESVPILRKSQMWTEIDYATASFGQGIAVTPLQMVRAVSAIANGGYLVTPQVVSEINSTTYSKIPKSVKKTKIISEPAASAITQMMVDSVALNKVGWQVPKGVDIAGKTGTAQIPIAGYYDPNKTIGSFIGFAPAKNPKFVMLVTLHQTKASPWGSRTAAPVWFEIANEILRYDKISLSEYNK